MSIVSKLGVFLCTAAIAGAPFVAAQDPKPVAPPPLFGDPNKPADKPATRPAAPLPPLEFKKPLPTTPIGTIDGTPVTQGDLLRFLVRGNWQTVLQTLVLVNLLDLELKKAGITVTDKEIEEEQARILERVAPGKTPEEVRRLGVFNEEEMRRQAWLSRGWDRVFIAENKIQPENTGKQENAILKQLFIRQKMEKYDVKQRGQDPAPPTGLILEIKEKEGPEVRTATADDALAFLMGLVKPGSLQDAVQEVVDGALIDRELAKAGKSVTDDEIEAWAASMTEKYKPPFDWRMICQFKGTTPDGERERWRRIQAWKRVTGYEVKEEEVKKFIQEHEDHFSGQNKTVSHILRMTADTVTGLPGTPEKEAEAKAAIDDIYKKLEEGLDFGWVAEHYSEDVASAKAKGALTQPIKKFGGGLDPEFQKAAWNLKQGEISRPVKSKYGWHVIRCDKVTPGQRGGADFDAPAYREWIVDEFETIRMKQWIQELRSKSKIDLVSNAELFKIKDLRFK
jgi:hypothetical protein